MNRLHYTVTHRLKPFEELYYELRRKIFALVSKMTEAERRKLEGDFAKLTSTNCSWVLPRVKEHVEDAIKYYRDRDDLIEHVRSLEAELEKETDHYIRSDIQRSIDAALKQLEARDE